MVYFNTSQVKNEIYESLFLLFWNLQSLLLDAIILYFMRHRMY